jgi:hypothetical protein
MSNFSEPHDKWLHGLQTNVSTGSAQPPNHGRAASPAKAALDAGHNLTQEVERRVEQSFARCLVAACGGMLRRNTYGVSATKFDQWSSDGRMPKPKRIDGCRALGRARLGFGIRRPHGPD